MISCARNGISTAVLSVVSVRRAWIFRSPYGSTVSSPSFCCQRSVESWHRCLRAVEYSVSVSLSSCSLLSARCTSVTSPNIIRWSRVVRSSSISLVSLRCSSMSYGIVAVKLLLAFWRRCQLATFVSTPSKVLCSWRAASSVGTGRMSIDSIKSRSRSQSSDTKLSLM